MYRCEATIPLAAESTRASQPPVLFWSVSGLKQIDCFVTPQGDDSFLIYIERGTERERHVVHRVATVREALTATQLVKATLLKSGWTMVADSTAAAFQQLTGDVALGA